jgi:hypothetical protein
MFKSWPVRARHCVVAMVASRRWNSAFRGRLQNLHLAACDGLDLPFNLSDQLAVWQPHDLSTTSGGSSGLTATLMSTAGRLWSTSYSPTLDAHDVSFRLFAASV